MAGRETPRVTVLMPVYNGAPFIGQAVDSVLAQTYREIELLIIDDGSEDDSGDIAGRYAHADSRVRIEYVEHCGLVGALNLGLDLIDTELIARADADDINHPDRLQRQIIFLDTHPEVGVCGTGIVVFPGNQAWALPLQSDELRATLLFGVPFYHSTVVMRRDWIARSGCRYDPAFTHAEDYDFWERAAAKTAFANLAEPLVRYRRHPAQVSAVHYDDQQALARSVRRRLLTKLDVSATEDQLQLHEDIVDSTCGTDPLRLATARGWLETLREANHASRYFQEPAFSKVLADRWYRCCGTAALSGLPVGIFSQTALASVRGRRWLYVLRLLLLRFLGRDLGQRLVRRWNLLRYPPPSIR